MSRLALSTDGTDNDFEINFYNYHAIDVLEIVLKDTGLQYNTSSSRPPIKDVYFIRRFTLYRYFPCERILF